MKKMSFKTLIIIIDIFVFFGLIFLIINWSDNNKNNSKDSIIHFKDFTYTIPSDIEYISVETNSFVLNCDQYKAYVKIFTRNEVDLLTNVINYGDYMLNQDIEIISLNAFNIDDTTIYVYKKSNGKNSLLYYFDTIEPFLYEVELYNNDNSFNADYFSSIFNILKNASYNNHSYSKNSYYTASEIFHINDTNEN